MKILRARPTRHFLFLLVRCRCGKSFGHRADRRMIVCYHCGRIADLAAVVRRRGRRSTESKSGPGKPVTTRKLTARSASRRSRKG